MSFSTPAQFFAQSPEMEAADARSQKTVGDMNTFFAIASGLALSIMIPILNSDDDEQPDPVPDEPISKNNALTELSADVLSGSVLALSVPVIGGALVDIFRYTQDRDAMKQQNKFNFWSIAKFLIFFSVVWNVVSAALVIRDSDRARRALDADAENDPDAEDQPQTRNDGNIEVRKLYSNEGIYIAGSIASGLSLLLISTGWFMKSRQ